MKRVLSDIECANLIAEQKTLPKNWRTRLKPRPKVQTAFAQASLDVTGATGHRFRIFVRKNVEWQEDFSIGLIFIDDGTQAEEYVLTRYNGSSHKHTNHIEKEEGKTDFTFANTCHIHRATERYQKKRKIDGYAEPTSEFQNFDSAFSAFISGNGFEVEGESSQRSLFQ